MWTNISYSLPVERTLYYGIEVDADKVAQLDLRQIYLYESNGQKAFKVTDPATGEPT